jgi:hypothetical protein
VSEYSARVKLLMDRLQQLLDEGKARGTDVDIDAVSREVRKTRRDLAAILARRPN